jgi:uncharacterized protein
MDISINLIYLLIGIFAGFFAGLLGIGGGLITVPALLLIFHRLGFPAETIMQTAIGTSLAAMVFTSASSAWAHYLKKGVYWHIFIPLIPGIFIGSILGAFIVSILPSKSVALIVGISECLIGFYFFLPKTTYGKEWDFRGWMFALVGVIIGIISTVLGIGGGVITVPILTVLKVPIRNAISTSAVTGFLIAIVGAISFLLLGFQHANKAETIGYLYIPAFLIIGVSSTLIAPIGARYAYIFPTEILKKVFGLLLIGIGFWMVFSNNIKY